jgi:hypothetical protein
MLDDCRIVNVVVVLRIKLGEREKRWYDHGQVADLSIALVAQRSQSLSGGYEYGLSVTLAKISVPE